MKKILKDDSLSGTNFLEFVFEDSELNVNFTGTPAGYMLFSVKNPNILLAVKEYLNHPDFQFLKPVKNYSSISFGNLRFNLGPDGDYVLIFVAEKLSERHYDSKKVYMPSSSDLILWTIVNAGEDFSIEKIRNEILLENSLKK